MKKLLILLLFLSIIFLVIYLFLPFFNTINYRVESIENNKEQIFDLPENYSIVSPVLKIESEKKRPLVSQKFTIPFNQDFHPEGGIKDYQFLVLVKNKNGVHKSIMCEVEPCPQYLVQQHFYISDSSIDTHNREVVFELDELPEGVTYIGLVYSETRKSVIF